MDSDQFRQWLHRTADWSADYRTELPEKPVRAQTAPGEIAALIADSPPESPESFEKIFADFEAIVPDGMTHWQHPRFFAYFPSNAAPESVIAENLASAMAAQCMLWQTSPAATEIETKMMDWLRQAIGLSEGFSGVIQDSASSATLCAVLIMRERALDWKGNESGLTVQKRLRIYASDQVHTSVDRAIWVAGVGQDNLVRIPTSGRLRSINVEALDAAIEADLAADRGPAGIIACTGGTSTGSSDDIDAVCKVAGRHGLYVHVDAAWAGSAMICPEFRELWNGVNDADSVVFNPHKWLGVQFDCSAHFLRNPDDLVRTLAIRPEYLKTHGHDGLINYSEWTVPLGRRFRALKVWFLMRSHGLENLRAMIRDHVEWSNALAGRLRKTSGFELVTEPVLSLFSFRHVPAGVADPDAHNLRLLDAINDDGRIYLTQTKVDGAFAIRFQAGSFNSRREDVDMAYDVITEIASKISD